MIDAKRERKVEMVSNLITHVFRPISWWVNLTAKLAQ